MGKSYRDRVFKNRKRNSSRSFNLSNFFDFSFFDKFKKGKVNISTIKNKEDKIKVNKKIIKDKIIINKNEDNIKKDKLKFNFPKFNFSLPKIKYDKILLYSVASLFFIIIGIFGISYMFKNNDRTEIIEAQDLNIIDNDKNPNKENTNEKIDKENKENNSEKKDKENKENNSEKKDKENINKKNEEDIEVNNEININPNGETSIVFLGDIMMGGNIGRRLDYMYSSSFKDIRNYTRNADLTFASFTTLITDIDNINNPKSKYIVKKDIINGLSALGVDMVNLASSHMTDYEKIIFNNTVNILKDNDFGIAGLKDNIYYTTSNNKKIAFVSFNCSYNGIKNTYSDYGINIYNKENLINEIEEAKSNSDFIIACMNWGRDNKFEVTEEMKEIAKISIDNGANLVVGMNALGNYPIVEYKDTPIIYSLGDLISDSALYLDRASYMHKVYINKENKIDRIEMVPIYVLSNISVKYFDEYNKKLSDSFANQMNSWNNQNSLNSIVEDGKIIIKFN